MQQAFGHVEVLAGRSLKLPHAGGICLHAQRGCARLGPNTRPAREEEQHQRDSAELPRFSEVMVPDRIGVTRQLAAPEIHEEEREVVQHIDTRDFVVELDGIEESGLAVV
jgi:hypothetical protein